MWNNTSVKERWAYLRGGGGGADYRRRNRVYQSINVEFFKLLQCFTFQIILSFYAILHDFVLYSQYGDSSKSENLNGHQAFESMSLLGALISLLK